jgi:hypothetical protein
MSALRSLCDLWKAYWEALTLSGYEQGYKDGYKASERVAEERDMESPQDGTNGTQAIGPVAEESPQKGTQGKGP